MKRAPTAAQRMPVWRSPPPPGRGQAHRTIEARDREDAHEALARVRATDALPWRDRTVGLPVRTGARVWTLLIRELPAERLTRLRALEERRAAGGGR